MVFSWHLGILALALTLSVSVILQFILLLIALNHQLGGFSLRHLLLPPLKMILASVAMGVCLWLPMRLLDQFVFDTTKVINLIALTVIAGSSGLGVYLGLSALFGIAELSAFVATLRRLGNWRRALAKTEEVIE